MSHHLYRGTIAYDEPRRAPLPFPRQPVIPQKWNPNPLTPAQRKAAWRDRNLDHVRAKGAGYQRAYRDRQKAKGEAT
jgi:hypothetical protein